MDSVQNEHKNNRVSDSSDYAILWELINKWKNHNYEK